MHDENYDLRLQQLWQQGQRSIAVSFLQRAIGMDTPLSVVAAALQFPQVRAFLKDIRLHELHLGEQPQVGAARPASAPAGAAPLAASAPRKGRRPRRGPAQMQTIKEHLWRMLQKEPGSLDTTQLHEGLVQLGHDVDRITLKRLLCQLQDEAKVTCLGGRPKAWRQVSPVGSRQQTM